MQKFKNRFYPILISFLIILIIGFGWFQFTKSAPTSQIPVTGGKVVSTSTLIPPNAPVLTITQTPFVMTTTPLPLLLGNGCNQASFVQDVTIPDGTQLPAGNSFNKIWRLQNTGSCSWTPNYHIVFDSGNILGAPGAVNMPTNVNPGQMVDISVSMVAPTANGTYTGNWRLRDPNGASFGVGAGANKDFFVNISVINAAPSAPSFRVSHIIMSVDTNSVKTSCPPNFPFTLNAQIETTQPGSVTYHWEFSNGQNSDRSTIMIGDSLTQTVTVTVIPIAAGAYWARINDDSPNHQEFGQVFFTLTCQ